MAKGLSYSEVIQSIELPVYRHGLLESFAETLTQMNRITEAQRLAALAESLKPEQHKLSPGAVYYHQVCSSGLPDVKPVVGEEDNNNDRKATDNKGAKSKRKQEKRKQKKKKASTNGGGGGG